MHGLKGVEAPHLDSAVEGGGDDGVAPLVMCDARHRLGVIADVPHQGDTLPGRLLLPHLHLCVARACDHQVPSLGIRRDLHRAHRRDGLLVEAFVDPLGPHPRELVRRLGVGPVLLGLVVDVIYVNVGRPEDEQQLHLNVQMQLRHPCIRRLRVLREREVQLEAFYENDPVLLLPTNSFSMRRVLFHYVLLNLNFSVDVAAPNLDAAGPRGYELVPFRIIHEHGNCTLLLTTPR
mmetsp:Transcript_38234/g.83176  ORF Transcript_38234/g.83176 Transcript_38234/m.83176 type:complete len:234 (-) Transcript_38234:77-778(-)